MKIEVVMCHSHLLSMLLQPKRLEAAVVSYTATKPLVSFEGMAGYIETTVTFNVANLSEFTKLFEDSRSYPSNQTRWYHTLLKEINLCDGAA